MPNCEKIGDIEVKSGFSGEELLETLIKQGYLIAKIMMTMTTTRYEIWKKIQ